MKKINLPAWAFPLALMLLALLTYGPLLPQLGLYWDDWPFAWTRANLGLQGLRDLFEITRPIRGWIEALLTPLLGISVFRWQAYALLMRGLAAVSFWWFLRHLWPERQAEALLAASILVVFPGYTQQPQAMTYHYYWTFFGLLFLSFVLMIRSVRVGIKPVWWLLVISVVLCALQLASMEYLLGIEILRPFILWLALAGNFPSFKERFKRVVLYELPYAIALLIYLYWRFFMYAHSIYSPVLIHEAGTSPIGTLGNLISITLNAISIVMVQSWLQTFHFPAVDQLGVELTWIVVLIMVFITAGWAALLQRADDETPRPVPWDWIGLGFGGMLVAGLPFFIAGLPIRVGFPENRVTLPYIPLAGMVIAGLVRLIPGKTRQFLVAGLLLACAAAFQISTANLYRDQYKLDKSFFWQLTWRAPALKPGTAVISQDDKTFLFDDDEALTYPLNWVYAPNYRSGPQLYQYQTISIRLQQKLSEMLANPQSSQAVVVRFAPPSCLHVLDPRYDQWLLSVPNEETVKLADGLGMPFVPENTRLALPLSNTSQILSQASQPLVMPELLGAEPEHKWCFYYQKADLARQQGDWKTVADLGDKAFALKLLPDDPYEYQPFIEAYARLGRIKDARLMTRQAADAMPLLRTGLCDLWMRVGKEAGVTMDVVQKEKIELESCPAQ